MLTTLLESRHHRSSTIQFQLVSVAVHTALIVGAVVATRGIMEAGPPPRTEVSLVYTPTPKAVVEASRPATALPVLPGRPAIPTVLRIPDALPEIGIVRNLFLTISEDCVAACPQVGAETRDAPASNGVMTADQVERVAFLRSGTGRPAYPEALRSAGIEGEVTVQFVIDTTGRADMATLIVLNSSHGWFTQAATRALQTARFVPAEFGGRRVRQIVQMPFVFSLKK